MNWNAIKSQRESKALKDNERENTKRKQHVYKEGNKYWIVQNKYERNCKSDKVAEGPFVIMKVYNNGTLRLDRNGYSEVIHI